jgi:hypothetical protein
MIIAQHWLGPQVEPNFQIFQNEVGEKLKQTWCGSHGC